MSDSYVPLSTRLVHLETRIDSAKYNEIQGKLYYNCCKDLDNIPAKACRLITKCDIPEAEICKVTQNFKTVIPPSHPRSEFPLYVMADLLPCYLPGRTICPEFELMTSEDGIEFPTDHVIKKDKADLGFGELWVQTEYSVNQSCCNECDKKYNYDYLRLKPTVKTWFNGSDDPFIGSDSYSDDFDLVHEKIHVRVANSSLLNIAKKEISVKPFIEITSECSDSQSFSYSLSATADVLGQKVKIGFTNQTKIDWCASNIDITPDISIDISGSDIVGDLGYDTASIPLCYEGESFLDGYVGITPTLQSTGKISNDIDFRLSLGNAGYSGTFGVVSNVSKSPGNNVITVFTQLLTFNHGILCSVDDGDTYDFEIKCDCICDCSNSASFTIDCDYIRDVCGCCCKCDSSSSSVSSSSISSSSYSSSSSSKPKPDPEPESDSSSSSSAAGSDSDSSSSCLEGMYVVTVHITQEEDPDYPQTQRALDMTVTGYTTSLEYNVGDTVYCWDDLYYGPATTCVISSIDGRKCFSSTDEYMSFFNSISADKKFKKWLVNSD